MNKPPSEPLSSPAHATPKLLIGITLAAAISNLGQSAAPFVLSGAIADLGFSAEAAAQLVSIELAGFGLGSAACATRVHVWNRSHLCLYGAIVVAVANGLSCYLELFPLLLACRLLAGVGSAVACSSYSATAASTPNPARTFAIVNAVNIAGSGIFVWGTGLVASAWQLQGIFLALAVLSLVFGAGFRLIPAHAVALTNQPDRSSSDDLKSGRQRLGVVLCLAMMFAIFAGQGGVWANQAELGRTLGMSSETVGFLQGIGRIVFGAGASLLAAFVGTRMGHVWPQVLTFAGSIAAVQLLGGFDFVSYAVGSTLLTASWFWGLAFQQALLSRFDRLGRANVASDALSTFGLAAGPLLVASVYSQGFNSLIAMVTVIFVIAFALALGALAALRGIREPHPR